MTCPGSRPAGSPPSSASSSSLHLVILAAREGWHTRELTRALEARGHTGAVVPYEGLVATIGRRPGLRSRAADLDRADAVLARIIPSGSLEQIIFRVDALHRLEDRGVRVMNSPRAIERTVDKFWTSALLEQCGLPTPETIVCETPEEAIAAFRALGDVIVKPLFGSMGLGMVRVSDEEMAFRVFKTIETIRGVYYLQRAIDHEGRDIRAFVVGDGCWRPSSAVPTAGAPTSRAEARRGRSSSPRPGARSRCGRRRPSAPSTPGVDLLPARDGSVYVLEVNGIPGLGGTAGRHRDSTSAGAVIDQLRGPARVSTPDEVAAAGQLACLLEVSAPKPGNVSPGPPLPRHAVRGLPGQRRGHRPGARRGGRARRSAPPSSPPSPPPTAGPPRTPTSASFCCWPRWRGRPCGEGGAAGRGARRARGDHRGRRRRGLRRHPARAARRAGLLGQRGRRGRADRLAPRRNGAGRRAGQRRPRVRHRLRHDVRGRRARAARGPRRRTRLDRRHRRDVLRILAALPDTHIARKLGRDAAEAVSRRARDGGGGGRRADRGRAARRSRRSTRSSGAATNARNPGTTADLTCAALFVVILEDGWNR